MRKLSFCITTFNRYELTMECVLPLCEDRWVDQIIIVDDCSDIEIYEKLKEAVKDLSKVKLYRNEKNLGVYYNKKRSVELATNDFVVVADSDNIYGKDFITKKVRLTSIRS